MAQTKTAKEILAYIEKKFFKGAGLAKAVRLEGEERRAYRFSQVDRLLMEIYSSVDMAMWLSDMFWTGDEGKIIPEKPNPLMTLAGQQTLTDKEIGRLRLILEIAGLGHDLSLHYMFDLKEAFGVKNNWWVSNKQLVEWLTATEYEHIAMHVAYIMKKHAIGIYAYGHYLPAQDALAELYSMEHCELVRQPDDTKIPPRDYVKTILDEMLRIERHWQRGRRLKLRPDVVMLHDEIYGVVPYQFDKGVLKAAQELYDFMDREVYGNTSPVVFERFEAKVREVRSKYLAEGWITDDSLAFSYLMAHAERCGYGQWREEDEAL